MPRILAIVFAAIVVVAIATAGRYLMLGGGSQQANGPNIGGPFTLTDQTGKQVTDQDFRGKYMLIYFGYTFCPDVCPTSLSTMGDALDQLSPQELDKLVPIFISVDPERDTPELLASYVPNFHDKLIGMTGTPEQIKTVTREYKAYYAKVNEDDPDGNYLMDHSSITYLMGPDGTYVTHFNHGTSADKMAARLAEIL